MKLKMLAVFAALAFALPGAAYAQHKHGHAHAEKGPNGGAHGRGRRLPCRAGREGRRVEIYVMDHDDKPLSRLQATRAWRSCRSTARACASSLDAGDGRKDDRKG